MRDLGVGVVREFTERVEDLQLRVGDGDEREGERHRAPDHRLSVPQLQS